MRWAFILLALVLLPIVIAERQSVTVFTTPASSPNWSMLPRAYDGNWSSFSSPTADNSPLYFDYYYLLPVNLTHGVFLESKSSQHAVDGCTTISCWNYTSSGWWALDYVCDASSLDNNLSIPRACFNSDITLSKFRVFSTPSSRFYEANMSYVPRSSRNLSYCAVPYNEIASFYAYEESSPTDDLNVSFKIEGELTFDGLFKQNFSYVVNGSNRYHFCLNSSSNIKMTAYVQQANPSGFTHRYYLVNQSVSPSSPINVSLYNFDSTTGISDLKLTVRNKATYQYLDGIYGLLQRRYVGEGVWRTVQMDQSGDFGELFFNIIEENTDYKLIFLDSAGDVIETSSSMKFICTSGLCELTYLLDLSEDALDENDLRLIPTYDNVSGLLNVTWDDPTGRTTAVHIYLTKPTLTGTTTICAVSVSGASGEYNCNASGFTGTLWLRIMSTTYGVINPEYSAYIVTSPPGLSAHLDPKEGAVWTAAFVLVIAGIGFISPVGVIIATVFSLVVSYVFGLLSALTLGGIMVAVVIGVVIGLKVKS